MKGGILMDDNNYYTKGEEIANAITHGIGAILSIGALVLLVVFSSLYGDAWYIVSYSIYGTTLVILYAASTLYHSLPGRKTKHLFQIFDHSSIYLLIAGTYTPYILTKLRSPLGWTIFGIVWGLGILGIIMKTLWVDRYMGLSTIIYVIMGWLIVIEFKPLMNAMPTTGLVLLIVGGILYTLGAVLFMFDNIPYNHAVWHIFVLAGSICHFFSIIKYLLIIK